MPDGPHVIRLRAHLVSGESIDEFLVVSIERNAPLLISAGELVVGNPTVSGRRVVWPVAESEEPGAPFDLALGRLRLSEVRPLAPSSSPSAGTKDASSAEPHNRLLFEREGSQGDVAMSGDLLAWRVRDGAVTTIEWCRLAEVGNCEPESVLSAEGFIAEPFVGGNWIVWHRNFAGTRIVEGCYVAPDKPRCDVIPLIDDEAARRWAVRSFDGDSMLIETSGVHALCHLDARGVACRPSPIEFAEGTPSVFEPVHHGSLVAFSEVNVESRPPLGCLPFELVPGCFPTGAVVVGYRACWLEAGTNRCDSVRISPLVRSDYFVGLEVEGRRIAWSMATATEEATVQFCEFDPVTRNCEIQRVTGSAARQDGVALDKNRIVWRDGRRGERAIWGTELTTIHGPDRVRKRAGSEFSIVFWVSKGTAPALSYSVRALSGLDPSMANVRIEDLGSPGGLVRLVGVLPSDAAGGHRWRVRAEASGGLYSESTFDLQALPAIQRRR